MFDKSKLVFDTGVYCGVGAFTNIFQHVPYVLIFKTTNWCWNNCAHCCESSNGHNLRNFMPVSVITDYIDQAIHDPQFSREVVFTGGEIMAAYKFMGKSYLPTIVNHALNAGCGVDFKTNAGWVDFPSAKQQFNDIENMVRNHANVDKDGPKTLSRLQVSLSLDHFHKDSMRRNFKFIKHFADTNIPGASLVVHVSSFESDNNMFPELLQKLNDSGVKISKLFVINKDNNEITPGTLYDLNGNVLVKYSVGKLFNGGRAAGIESAYKTPFPQFTFVNADKSSLVAFDSFGDVTLGENSGQKIRTKWDTGNAKKSLQTIKTELANNIHNAETEFLNQHRVLKLWLKWLNQVERFAK